MVNQTLKALNDVHVQKQRRECNEVRTRLEHESAPAKTLLLALILDLVLFGLLHLALLFRFGLVQDRILQRSGEDGNEDTWSIKAVVKWKAKYGVLADGHEHMFAESVILGKVFARATLDQKLMVNGSS